MGVVLCKFVHLPLLKSTQVIEKILFYLFRTKGCVMCAVISVSILRRLSACRPANDCYAGTGHFGPKTVRTRHFGTILVGPNCPDTSALVSKCLFPTLRTQVSKCLTPRTEMFRLKVRSVSPDFINVLSVSVCLLVLCRLSVCTHIFRTI